MDITKEQIGFKVRMQPYIDSDIWKHGVIIKVEKDWFYIDWDDLGEMQHYHQESKDMVIEPPSAEEKNLSFSTVNVPQNTEPSHCANLVVSNSADTDAEKIKRIASDEAKYGNRMWE